MLDRIDWRAELRAHLGCDDGDAGDAIDAARQADVVEELASHLEDQHAELVARGMEPRAARDRLLAQLDDPESPLRAVVAARIARRRALDPIGVAGGERAGVRALVASIGVDLRYGWRSLRRTPAFTAVIVLSLAIVIGANTAIFGLLDSILLRRLAVPRAAELVALRPTNAYSMAPFALDDYETLMRTPGLPRIEAYRLSAAVVGERDDQTAVWIELVSGGYFDLMRVPPLLGRTLSVADERSANAVAVVSEDFWRDRMGGDRAAVGKPIVVNGARVMLVGVMPHSYHDIFFAHAFTLAVPLAAATVLGDDPRHTSVALVARFPRGADDAAMRERVTAAYRNCCVHDVSDRAGVSRSGPRPPASPSDAPVGAFGFWSNSSDATPHMHVVDASRGITWGVDFRAEYRLALYALMGGVGVLLLIACANVGTLLLSRATTRGREFAVRMSLGASRARMLRQLLTETLELALAGTVLGIALAWGATAALLHGLPSNAVQLGDVIAWRASPAIFAFTVIAMIGCTLVAGVWPARRAARTDVLAAISGADRARSRGRGWPAEQTLVCVQVALALVLASSAWLFVATLRNLQRGDGGYRTRNVLVARLDFGGVDVDAPRASQSLRAAVERLPGVDAAALSLAAPVLGDAIFMLPVEIPGRAPVTGERPPWFNAVSPGFFASTGVGLAAGREFDASDADGREGVAIVNETFARRYFAGRNPIGRSITLALKTRRPFRIVGVAHDAQYGDVHAETVPMWYMPLDQALPLGGRPWFALTLRTSVDPVSVASTVRRAIAEVEPGAYIRQLTSVGQLLDDALARERFAAALAAIFGAVALGLAAIGVYGVTSHSVARRTSEIGVRMALGAAPADALWLVMRQAVVVALCGVLVGAPLAVAADRGIASQLYGISATDLRVVIVAALVLAVVAAIAALLPGRRAAGVDPVVALRAE